MKILKLPYPLQLTLYTLLFAGITKIGLMFSFVDSNVSQIWSPAGLSIVILFIAGAEYFPAIIIGVAVNYLFVVHSSSLALALAVCSSLEGYIGYLLLKRSGFDPSLQKLTDVGKLIVFGGMSSTLVNAVLSVAVFSAYQPSVLGHFFPSILLWWLGNLVGVIVLSPILFMAVTRRFEKMNNRRLAEFLAMTILVYILSYIIFHGKFFTGVLNYSLAFVLFPFVIVVSIRFGMIGSVVMTYLISLNATLSTQTGLGLFAAESYSVSIFLVDIFVIVIGSTSLALAALIEERSMADRILRISEERYRITTERTGQLIYDYDITAGTIQWSGAVEPVTQCTPEEFSSVNIDQWLQLIHPDDRERAGARLLETMRMHQEYYIEYRFRRKDGTYIDVLDRGAFLYLKHNDLEAYRMLGTMADITDMKNTVQLLKESEERYRLFSLLTSDYIYSAAVTGQTLVTEWASEAFQKITGYTLEEIESLGGWGKIIHPDDVARAFAETSRIRDGQPVRVEYRIRTKNGDIKWLRDYIKPITGNSSGNAERFMGGVQDITERKNVEERFRVMIDKIADGIILLNNRGIITYVSSSATSIIGFSPEDLLNTSIFSILHPSEAKKYAFKFGRLTAEYERSEYLLGRFRHKNGDWVYIEGMVTNVFNNSSVNAFVANFRNVSERIKAEDQLHRSLKEKEILLQEVHHRVKNNMQVISSLLNLQSAKVKDKTMQSMFRESQNRVKSMSLVHEILYRSQDLASVNFTDYAKQLVASLEKSFGAKMGVISISIKIPKLFLEIDAAIPCGLIINELVSNALKHAFPKKRNGEIIIEMKKKKPSLVQLSVRDNGIGLPKGSLDSSSLGLTLVQALTEQLKGTIAIENKKGMLITIEFPIQTPAAV